LRSGNLIVARLPSRLVPRGAVAGEDDVGDTFGGVALHRWRHVGVDLPCDVGAAVVETLADDLDVDGSGEGEGGPGVAEAVEGDRRDLLIGIVPVEVALVAVELP
jgi:hypothetical protein